MTQWQIVAYRAALKQAREEFEQAKEEQEELSARGYANADRIARLRRTITSLAAMCGEEPLVDPLGITEACTEVMQTTERALETVDVVRKLDEIGFDTESQKNISASVNAVLNRLATRGVIQRKVNKDSKVITWRGPKYTPLEGETE